MQSNAPRSTDVPTDGSERTSPTDDDAASPTHHGGPTGEDQDGQPLLVDVPPELRPDRPPLIDRNGRVRLSFSRIDTYDNCPRKFRYRYVDRLPGRPAPALSFGTSVHAALERFYDRKLPEEPTEEELLGFLFDGWDTSGFAALDRDEQLAWYRQGQRVLREYHRRTTGTYRLPVATEAWFELPFGDDAVVVGSIDRVDSDEDGELHVVDYKTNKRASPRQRVARSLQLAIYALACEHLYGRLPATVALDFVVPGVTVSVGLDEIDLDAARGAVAETAAGVRAEAYAATPNRLCDWCDFREVCPAWAPTPPDGEILGEAVDELARLERSVGRDLERLRDLRAGIGRLREDVAQREAASDAATGATAPDDVADDVGGPAADR